MKTRKLLLALAVWLMHAGAQAGSVKGPYVVWMNLAKNPDVVDLRIRQIVNSGKADCWNSAAILFMGDKPKTITQALVTAEVLRGEKHAIKQLNKMLTQAHGNEATDGFDGIVVHTDQPKPAVFSLTTGLRRIEHISLNLAIEPRDLELSFCRILPPISRQP